jgi:glycosyltransferase involved in cell wall biosynthesis
MFPDWEWQVLSMPARHFSWRVRGNPLYWSLAERDSLEQPFDLLIATSMVDLATLRGLVPGLAQVPSLLYFHENQFDYPRGEHQSSLLEAQMVSLYGALAADSLAFNSAYNRDSFLAGVGALLRKLPDRVPPGVTELLAAKSQVLPVPLLPATGDEAGSAWPGSAGELPVRPLRLLWSGRFEHDKGGEGLWRVLQQLEHSGLDYELALTGQQFRQQPEVFTRIAREFGYRLVHFGYLESAADYRALLGAADIVLSTALHEFQGLAVLEAVARGCVPVVPARQAYPELYPAANCYQSCPHRPEDEASAAARLIITLAKRIAQGETRAPDVWSFQADQLRGAYLVVLQGLAGPAG